MSSCTKGRRVQDKKIILGVTGGFGTGKTTVVNYFKKFGAKIIDADKIAHRLIRPNSKVYRKIVGIFGGGILKKNKSIDREKLSGIIFNDKDLLKKLNRSVHPEVIRVIQREIKQLAGKMIVLDVPLLFEAGLERLVDKTVVVKVSKAKQLARLAGKALFSKENILRRIKAQLPLSDKIRRADFVIDNNGTFEKTKEQVERLRRMLWKN